MTKEWRELPAEVKEMVVKHCTENTRNALRACSTLHKQVVENTKLTVFPCLEIGRISEKLTIAVRSTKWHVAPPDCEFPEFETFEEFQKGLTNVLRKADCIKKLRVYPLNSDTALNLLVIRDGLEQKLKVETLKMKDVEENTIQLESILAQVEPVYLNKVKIVNDGGNGSIYDMPQILNAQNLHIEKASCIREDQLMKLDAKFLILGGTECSLLAYVKRCAEDISDKQRQFSFYGLNAYAELEEFRDMPQCKTAYLETENPQLAYELAFTRDTAHGRYAVHGSVVFDSQRTASIISRKDSSVCRSIKKLFIHHNSYTRIWRMNVTRNNHSRKAIKCRSAEEFQETISEILDNTDFIRKFELYADDATEKVIWQPREKQLMVRSVRVLGRHSVASTYDLLSMIDPAYLTNVCIQSMEMENGGKFIMDLPQVYTADHIDVRNLMVRDEHLARINARYIRMSSVNSSSITEAGINQYIKNCFLRLDKMRCHFEFFGVSPELSSETMFEGLDVVTKTASRIGLALKLKSAHSKYEIYVHRHRGDVRGVRI